MASIPKNNEALVEMIYSAYQRKEASEQRLTRIGASGVGEECVRAIWYDWRGATNETHSGRLLRLFQTGHMQETRVVQDLKDAGMQVWEIDPETGQQWTYTAADGHFVCKADGVVKGVPGAEKTPHLLEIKSSNAKGFKEITSRGAAVAKPVHYYQMQAGMWLSGLKDALYVVICKDDEGYYVERIKRDDAVIADIQRKLDSLTSIMSPPPRLAEKENDWRCKFCDSKEICWTNAPMLSNCRTCMHSVAKPDGVWFCDKHDTTLTSKEQLAGCSSWLSY